MSKTVTGTKRAALYLRRSTDRQEQSLSDQKAELERYASEYGYQVVDEYVDDAVSGASTKNRKGFQQMIKDAGRSNRSFDTILVYDVKRFSRGDTDEAGYYRYVLKQHGVEVVYVAEGFTGHDTDDLLRTTMQFLARQESKDLSKVTIRGQLSNVKAGWWTGGMPPYGYDLEYVDGQGTPQMRVRFMETGEKQLLDTKGKLTRTLAPRERLSKSKADKARLVLSTKDRVKLVERIFEMYVVEELGFKAIAEVLNHERILSPKNGTWSDRTGRGWSLSTIRSILMNPSYTGAMVWNRRASGKFHSVKDGRAKERNGTHTNTLIWNDESDWEVIPNTHRAIIDEQMFEAARKLRKDRSRRNGGAPYRSGRQKNSPFLLSGLIKCEHCGHSYHGYTINSGKKRKDGERIKTRYYTCGGAVAKGKSVCDKQLIAKEAFEADIIRRIGERVDEFLGDGGTKKLKGYLVAEAKAEYQVPQNRRRAIQAKLKKIDADIDRLIASLTPINKEHVDRVLKKLDSERRELQRELATIKEVPDSDIDINQLAAEIIGSIQGFEDTFKEGSLEERKEFIRLFVETIKLDAARLTATLHIRKFPAPATLGTGNSAFEMVAGAGSEHQKIHFPPVKVFEYPLDGRGNILEPIAA